MTLTTLLRTRALTRLERLCQLALLLGVAALIYGLTQRGWSALPQMLLGSLPGALALLFLWRAARASRQGTLSVVPREVALAGAALLAGQVVPGLLPLVTTDPLLLAGSAGMLVMTSLPGVGLLAFAAVLNVTFQVLRDEELTV
ncbi:hypothetical protein [Deinococcus sedimenti]|uniref:CidA/LrgA family protein n=1 Tax=Deinococcus sedimenti TaxID=1867090 RepID=A0ABQ2S614_9DEIO|nr:hypothetical protein [Deinococcus sedimenti]GGR89283.1 hypothetical protein GCM10008960_15410 [Deinococcus sedimenti]